MAVNQARFALVSHKCLCFRSSLPDCPNPGLGASLSQMLTRSPNALRSKRLLAGWLRGAPGSFGGPAGHWDAPAGSSTGQTLSGTENENGVARCASKTAEEALFLYVCGASGTALDRGRGFLVGSRHPADLSASQTHTRVAVAGIQNRAISSTGRVPTFEDCESRTDYRV